MECCFEILFSFDFSLDDIAIVIFVMTSINVSGWLVFSFHHVEEDLVMPFTGILTTHYFLRNGLKPFDVR